MNTSTRTSPFGQILNKLSSKLLASFIPLHARRAYFMASWARYLCNNNIPDEVLAKNVSAAMNHLVSPRGLIYFFNKQDMWQGLPNNIENEGHQLDPKQIALMNQLAVNAAPEWLRYSSEHSMRKDAQLAALAATACNHSATFQRKILQSYKQVEKPKSRGILATLFLGKE